MKRMPLLNKPFQLEATGNETMASLDIWQLATGQLGQHEMHPGKRKACSKVGFIQSGLPPRAMPTLLTKAMCSCTHVIYVHP